MDKEISKDLFEVEAPFYQSFEDIENQYVGNIIVVTNEQSTEHGRTIGGIVRYYTKSSKEIYDKWIECSNISEYDETIFFNLVRRNLLGGILYN